MGDASWVWRRKARSLPCSMMCCIVCCVVTCMVGWFAWQPTSTQAQTVLSSEGESYEDEEAGWAGAIQLGGYIETFHQWNFNRPENTITHLRGFDNRHNSFTLSNVVLDTQWDVDRVFGRIALQVGHTPSTYYLDEPELRGTGATNATGTDLWKYLQQAHIGYRAGPEGRLEIAAGLFLSPIGAESLVTYESWNWSRSNLFFGLPFYHTGVQATYHLDERWSVMLAGYNGWNSVVDNNPEKSVAAQLAYDTEELDGSILYFGGVERDVGAPEGRPWRHQFDLHSTWHATSRFSMGVHGNVGFEPNRFGTSRWIAGAGYLRYQLFSRWYLAGRADYFHEHRPSDGDQRADAIFWPVAWVSSGTATVDWRPHDQMSVRFEYRHDRAAGDAYFRRAVVGDGLATPFVANSRVQNTFTVGGTAWF